MDDEDAFRAAKEAFAKQKATQQNTMSEIQQAAIQMAQREAEREAVPIRHLRLAEANLASEFYDRLVEWINTFDKQLSTADEVGVRLVSFGETVRFHLRDMDYFNPSLIKFVGELDDGSQVELVQHVSQISILLMRLPRKNPEEPKRRMGFQAILEESKKPHDK